MVVHEPLAPAALDKLAARLPAGYDAKNVRIIRASAVIVPQQVPATALESALLAGFETAGGVPMITDGKPTIMRIVAWVAHAGMNKNRLWFEEEDLVEAARKITPPDILPMDFNHSAVTSWSMEQSVIGAWYAAEVAQDPRARLPRKSTGLLARGIIWSALFPDYSTRLLAEQARSGFIDFSMACIPEWTETRTDAEGEYEVARKPVFFTFSALDVAPADPDARGFGEEASQDAGLEEQFRNELTTATAAEILHTLRVFVASNRTEEPKMDSVQAILDFLKANAGTIASQETLLQTQQQLEGLVALVRQSPADTEAGIKHLAELEGQLQEATTLLQAATAQLEGAQITITELETRLADREEKLAAYALKEAEEVKQATLATRLAQLPEHIRHAHEAQPDVRREAQEVRWTAKTEEEWQEVLDTFALVPVVQKASFLARSEEQGKLPIGGGAVSVLESLSKFRD